MQANILIVDDVVDNIQVAMNILKEDNYSFSFATQGKEAIELVEDDAATFDLILLDIMMPGIDGFKVCKKIKQNPQLSDVPIIFLSAKVDIESISKGFSSGAVDYIIKPFHANELLARVRTHLQLYKAKRLLQQHNLDLESKVEYEHSRLISELEHNQKELIYVLAELMEQTSDETGKHIRRVAEMSSLLAHFHPTLTEEDEDILYHASPMHDIGKMTLPRELLHKPGRFTEEEFTAMQSHTVNAFKLLSCSKRKYVKAAATIAHEHHEKWNGKGYPQGLKASEIHVYGRIVALVDVFDALTHSRCYKDAWELDRVIGYIKEHSGIQFDPELVDIFMENIDAFKKIAGIKQILSDDVCA